MKRFLKIICVVTLLAGIFTTTASALAFDDRDFNVVYTPTELWLFPESGEVGTTFFKQIRARAGCLPYKFSVLAGAFPGGLSLSSDGRVTGVPTKLGVFRFTLRLAGAGCANEFAERDFQLTVNSVRVQVTSAQLPAGSVGTPYSFGLAGQGSGQLAWSLDSGSLPPGLSLGSNGTISGTPTAKGDFPVVVRLTDTQNPRRTDTKSLVLSIVDPLKLTVGPARPLAEVGRPFTTTLTATGGKAPYSWSAGTLPAGLVFDAAKGVVSGSPTEAGTYSIKLTVTDALATATAVDLKIKVAAPLAISTRSLKSATAGRAYLLKLRTTGGVRAFKWTLRGKLPSGLKLDAKAGAIIGTPRSAGTARFTVTVRDALGAVSTKRFALTVSS